MVQSKADRERQKLITDKCQSLIEVLLKDEDNKYCVDCDAKGPRWASWNLGVFLCIRCAGIHRNLGVHISKVKSVNLDAWTPEHVAYVQRMGNSRARVIYEANLPEDFRRPQTDTALESFIRAKYEHKKYIAQDFVDPGPPTPAFNIDEELKMMKEQKRSKVTGGGVTRIISATEFSSNPKPRPTETLALKNRVKATPGLVDLETVAATEAAVKSNKTTMDLLIGDDLNSPPDQTTSSQQTNDPNQSLVLTDAPIPMPTNNIDLDFSTPTSQSIQGADGSKKVLSKESILSLYSFSPSINAGTTAGTDPFGMNTLTSNDFSKPTSAASLNSTLGSLSTSTSNIPTQNISLMNISSTSGLSSLGSNNNNNNFAGPVGTNELLSSFGNQPTEGSSNQKFRKAGHSFIKEIDDLFAGLDILHSKPN